MPLPKRVAIRPPASPPSPRPSMYATSIVLTASVVEPKTRRSNRLHTTSSIRLAVPDKKKQMPSAATARVRFTVLLSMGAKLLSALDLGIDLHGGVADPEALAQLHLRGVDDG